MNEERAERIYELFHEMAALPEARRADALRERCGDDVELYEEVMSLLKTGAADEGSTASEVMSTAKQRKVKEFIGLSPSYVFTLSLSHTISPARALTGYLLPFGEVLR